MWNTIKNTGKYHSYYVIIILENLFFSIQEEFHCEQCQITSINFIQINSVWSPLKNFQTFGFQSKSKNSLLCYFPQNPFDATGLFIYLWSKGYSWFFYYYYFFFLKPGNFLKTKLADHKLKIQLQLKPLRHDDVSILPSSK